MKWKFINKKTIIIIMAIAMIAIIIVRLNTHGITKIGYNGKEERQNWSGTYILLNGTIQHTLYPEELQNILQIDTETEDGTISIEIKDEGGAVLFYQENIGTNRFEVPIFGKVTAQIMASNHKGNFNISCQVYAYSNTTQQEAGHIFLYGEQHGIKEILEKELQLWENYYSEYGMRDLFVELPYYTAEFLNIWMQSDNDDIFNELYNDWEKTAIHTPEIKEFYQQIKERFPETIFHGTDVGHQYATTGERYVTYLNENGQNNTEKYWLAKEAIDQGKYYYAHSDEVYRENTMTRNFMREYKKINGVDIMGIYGSAHTGIHALDYATNTVPSMANQLSRYYKSSVISEDLTQLAQREEPVNIEKIQIENKEYEALYFGKSDLSAIFPDYQCREYWRLENAYNDFKDCPTTGDMLPYNNYPMTVEEGQIFVIDYTKADGSVIRKYYRSDGNVWQGSPATEEFEIKHSTP